MSVVRTEIRRGAYFDSVVLMQLQAALAAIDGVEDAGAAMATRTNLDLLEASGLAVAELRQAAPDDLVLAVKAATQEAAAAALARVDELLRRRGTETSGGYRPKSLDGALRQAPDASWVQVSVPGRYATAVTRQALEAGRHVFLYSDNVTVEDEAALKSEAARLGLLVLGPDCGTAIVGGAGLGFANRVRRGGVGLVGASGTGIQAVTSRLHALGAGVSHALGTGGRDLSAAVGGATALAALDLLRRDPDTGVIVLVSKPPDRGVAARLLAAALAAAKPVVVCLLGWAAPARRLGRLHFAVGLDDAAELAARLVATAGTASDTAETVPPGEPRAPARGELRALFSGGTLAQELLQIVAPFLSPLASNLSAPGITPLAEPGRASGHTILDLGADEFTAGRLHPMIDPTLRLQRLRQEAEDPAAGLLAVDLVLGDGAYADPAAELAALAAETRGRRPDLGWAALVVGTDLDPQDAANQIERLEAAGVRVFEAVGALAEHVLDRVAPAPATGGTTAVALSALAHRPRVINVGVETFADSLRAQECSVVSVDWRPAAGGDRRLAEILGKLR